MLLPKGKKKSDADARLAKLVEETGATANAPALQLPADVTVAEYADRFLTNCTEIQPSTLAGYRATFKYILDVFKSRTGTHAPLPSGM